MAWAQRNRERHDDCSRLAYSEVHDDERAGTVTAFTRRGLDWFLARGIVTERLLSDNAWVYVKNKGLAQLLGERGIEHWRTKPYSPQTNGKVERLQQTMDREWARGLSYRSSADRREALPHWLDHYNESRRHSALGNRPLWLVFGTSWGTTASPASRHACACF